MACGLDAAEKAVEPASKLIEVVFGGAQDYVVGASVFYRGAAKRLLKLGETGPGMASGSALWCDAPEIEMLETLLLSIYKHLADDYRRCGELSIGFVLCGLNVVARSGIVKHKHCRDDFGGRGVWMLVGMGCTLLNIGWQMAG